MLTSAPQLLVANDLQVLNESHRLSRRQLVRRTGAGVFVVGTTTVLAGCTTARVGELVDTLASLDVRDAINRYRDEQGLLPVPFSRKLALVARTHVFDFTSYHPDVGCNGDLHSWSSHGNWTAGCYVAGQSSTYPIMWDKPREIAGYPDNGYEIAHRGPPSEDADDVVNSWKSSPAHNAVILNHDAWAAFPWQALGAFMGQGYACAWFGVAAE